MPSLNDLRQPHYSKDRVAKWKRQRIQEGISDYDVWNLDGWMLRVIPTGLRKLANNTHSYPGNTEFPTYKSWKEWLLETADIADRIDALGNAPFVDRETTIKNDEEIVKLLHEFFTRIEKNFFHLWD